MRNPRQVRSRGSFLFVCFVLLWEGVEERGRSGFEMGATSFSRYLNRDHFRPSTKKPQAAATLALGLPTRPLASPGPGSPAAAADRRSEHTALH